VIGGAAGSTPTPGEESRSYEERAEEEMPATATVAGAAGTAGDAGAAASAGTAGSAETAVPAACEVQVSLVSECGPARQENQDAAAAWRGERSEVALIVADGMGGHAAGREAAEIVVRRALDGIRDREPGSWEEALRRAVAHAHDGVLAAARELQRAGGPTIRPAMGATVVAAVVETAPLLRLHLAHVGDSRAYLFRGTSLFRLTRDHSLVGRMVADGLLGEDEAFGHPDSNVIERALGQSQPLVAEVQPPLELAAGDLVLLTTDGLHGPVPDVEIQRLLAAASTARDACDRLLAAAYRAGSQDNVTIGCLRLIAERPRRRSTRVEV
jgi:serine/threonine protein phosphatase PrpC